MIGIISVVFVIIELLVGFRFFFELFGANPLTPFVEWIYAMSTPLIAPFAGILGHPVTAPTGTVVQSVFDPSSLIALIVYALIGGVLVQIFAHSHHSGVA